MPIFKKKDDVLDLTDLQRRGLLKKAAEIEKQQSEASSDGYVDLDDSGGTSSSSDSGASALGFLDSLAGVGASSSGTSSMSSGSDSLEIQGLKNKLEDLEYKLERFTEKLAMIESKLAEFENRFF